MQVSNQISQLYASPQSKVQTTSSTQKSTEVTAQEGSSKIITMADRFITRTPLSEKSQEVFLGTPEEMVHETVDDIVRAQESGKGHWCGTPMMMDIMYAHSRFDAMVAQQDDATLESLRDYIVNEIRSEPSADVREILHTLYRSVDKAIILPQASATTGPDKQGFYTSGPSKDSQRLDSLDKVSDILVEKMANSDDKSERESVYTHYNNFRESYTDLKKEVGEEETQQRIEQLLKDIKYFHPPHVGFGLHYKF